MSFIASIFSGVLLTLSFPTVLQGFHLPDLSGLVWIALVPLIHVCRSHSGGRVAVLIFVTGLLYNALVSYWIFNAMYIYGDLSVLASLTGVLAMACILGVMLALFLVVAFCLQRRGFLPLLIGLPIFWTLCEWIRNYGPFGGYPWSQLAYSQGAHLSLMQSSDLFGVYGLSFLIVFVNVVVAELFAWLVRRRTFPWLPLTAGMLLVVANIAYGTWRIHDVEERLADAEWKKVGLVQPNVPQEMKWNPEQAEKSVRILSQLTEQAMTEGAELVIWPESAYPDALPNTLVELHEFSEWKVPLLMGAVTVQPPGPTRRPLLQNSAVQIDPEGRISGMYHKVHLVPLGEYIPLKNVLGFLEKVVPAIGDFIPGSRINVLDSGRGSYGVTICYEDLFPEISRTHVRLGAEFLTNLTNDAWYGDSSAPWQHLEFSRFRAIENRRPMLRSTNTGVTALIDPTGQVVAQLPPFQEGVLVGRVPLGTMKTLYSRYGDGLWLAFLGLLLAISMVIKNIRKSCPSPN